MISLHACALFDFASVINVERSQSLELCCFSLIFGVFDSSVNILGAYSVGAFVVEFAGLPSLKRLIAYSFQVCNNSSTCGVILLFSFLMRLLLYTPAFSLIFLWKWKLSPSLFSASKHLSVSQFSLEICISVVNFLVFTLSSIFH